MTDALEENRVAAGPTGGRGRRRLREASAGRVPRWRSEVRGRGGLAGLWAPPESGPWFSVFIAKVGRRPRARWACATRPVLTPRRIVLLLLSGFPGPSRRASVCGAGLSQATACGLHAPGGFRGWRSGHGRELGWFCLAPPTQGLTWCRLTEMNAEPHTRASVPCGSRACPGPFHMCRLRVLRAGPALGHWMQTRTLRS